MDETETVLHRAKTRCELVNLGADNFSDNRLWDSPTFQNMRSIRV